MDSIFEVVLELIFGVVVDGARVKTWIKTGLFLLVFEAITAVFALMSIRAYQRGNTEGCVVTAIMATVVGIGGLIGAIYGHKRDWI